MAPLRAIKSGGVNGHLNNHTGAASRLKVKCPLGDRLTGTRLATRLMQKRGLMSAKPASPSGSRGTSSDPMGLACPWGCMVEEVGVQQRSMRTQRTLSRIGFSLSLVAGVGVPVLLLVFAIVTLPYGAAAIDSYDDNILKPADRATLNSIGLTMSWILLAGTILGITAFTLGILSRHVKGFGSATIVLASVGPVLSVPLWFFVIVGATAPDYIAG